MADKYRMVLYPIEVEQGLEWAAEYPDIPGCFGGGDSPEEAIADARDNLAFYLQTLAYEGKKIPEPTNPYDCEYSGKLTLRLSKSLHKRAACFAEEEGVSLNSLIVEALTEHITREEKRENTVNELDAPKIKLQGVGTGFWSTRKKVSNFVAAIEAN